MTLKTTALHSELTFGNLLQDSGVVHFEDGEGFGDAVDNHDPPLNPDP